MSLLSAAYKYLPNIVLYIVTAYVEKIIGNSQFEFRCIDISIMTDHILWTGEVVEGELCGKGEGSADCKEGSADFKEYYDLVRAVVLFNSSFRLNTLY
jgi:hypothetical protein